MSENKQKRKKFTRRKVWVKGRFKKGKTKVLSTRRYIIYVSEIEKLISGI